MGITTHDLVKTTKGLVEANGWHIKLDGILFLNLTLGDATTSQLVHVTALVTRLFLSQDACAGAAWDAPGIYSQGGRGRLSGCMHRHGQQG